MPFSPGPMRTLAGAVIGSARYVYRVSREASPLRRNVELTDVGGAALYLLSDLSRRRHRHGPLRRCRLSRHRPAAGRQPRPERRICVATRCRQLVFSDAMASDLVRPSCLLRRPLRLCAHCTGQDPAAANESGSTRDRIVIRGQVRSRISAGGILQPKSLDAPALLPAQAGDRNSSFSSGSARRFRMTARRRWYGWRRHGGHVRSRRTPS